MSAEITTPTPRSPARRLLHILAAAVGVLLLVPLSLTLGRSEQRRWERESAEAQRRAAAAVPLGQVEGVVTLDGAPLADVEVAFLPDPARGTTGANANCYTDAQGRYALRTERHGRAGALVGHHRVMITDIAALPSPGGAPAPAGGPKKNRVPPAYSDPFRTPLRVEVKPGTQTVNLDLVTPQPEPMP